MFSRLLNAFTSRRAWVRQITVTAIAAASAWLIGDQLNSGGGLVAAIVCSLSIRISLYKSVREGLGQIVGTAIGAGVALATVYLFDFGFIAIGTTVLLCAVVARALHLGEVASVNVPVTALIVIGPGLSESTAFHRLNSTLIGASVAIVFSYFSHKKTPAGRTEDQIAKLGMRSARLLGEMSEGVIAGYDQDLAGEWLATGRMLIEEIPNARSQALEAKRYARWSPLEAIERAEELYIREIAIEHVVVQVRAIARTLFDLAVDGQKHLHVYREIATALSSASYAISTKVELLKSGKDGAAVDQVAEELRRAGSVLAEELIAQSEKISREQLVRCISLDSNIDIIADSLDESSPALTDVISPDEPASAKVLKLSPLEQVKNLFLNNPIFRKR